MMVLVARLPDAMVWDVGGVAKTRAPSFRLIIDYATLPGLPDFLSSSWCTLDSLPITAEDVAAWPRVLTSLFFLLFWPLFTGHKESLIWVNLAFLILKCF